MMDITIVNWQEPSEFMLLQVPAIMLALWLAWKIARGYVASVYQDSQLISDCLFVRKWGMLLKYCWLALFHIVGVWLSCAGFVGVASGLFGYPFYENILVWQIGSAAMLPVVALAERYFSD